MSEQRKTGLPFTQFFDSVMADIRKARDKRTSEAIKRTMATTERVAELSEKVTRGRLAKQFIEGDFWVEHLGPFLRSEAVLRPASLKSGEANPLDRINVEFLIGSGKVLILSLIVSTIDEWQARGEEAAAILEVEAEKRKRLAETRA